MAGAVLGPMEMLGWRWWDGGVLMDAAGWKVVGWRFLNGHNGMEVTGWTRWDGSDGMKVPHVPSCCHAAPVVVLEPSRWCCLGPGQEMCPRVPSGAAPLPPLQQGPAAAMLSAPVFAAGDGTGPRGASPSTQERSCSTPWLCQSIPAARAFLQGGLLAP